jgi:truncated hemoglobin YjbI
MHTKRLIQAAVVTVLSSLPLAVGCGDDAANPKATADAGGGDATTTTLYQRLGGHAGIRSAVDKIIQAELGDPQLASFFVNQVAMPVPAGHPTVDQIAECLTDQLGKAAGGSETYPTTVTEDAGAFTCRDMATIHRPLHITGGTFDKFLMIAAGELQTLGVADADIATVGAVLAGARLAVVDPNAADAGEMAFGGGATGDGGAGDAASTTLYQRLGNHAGIRSAVDHIVQAELGDPKIASFFFNQVATPIPAGHPNVDQLSECFTDLLASAAGGPEMYPTTVTDDAGSFTCRDLVAIHRPLHISGGTFDTFVMIAAGELQTLGVASSDIQTIGTVLNGTKAAIVDPNLGDAGEMGFDAGQD